MLPVDVREAIMRGIIGLLFALVSTGALAAEQNPFGIDSFVESGWTSNASDSALGGADFFVHQKHALEWRGGVGPLALRGGLTLEQTRYARLTTEDDLEATAGLEAGLALGAGVGLRFGYALTRAWLGEALTVEAPLLGLRGDKREHEVLAELVLSGENRLLTIGVDGLWRQPADTTFSGIALPPLRLEPEIRHLTLRADGEWALAPELALLARAHGFVVAVPPADRFIYGREPADGARLAAGLRARQAALSLDGWMGLDVAWPVSAPELRRAIPYLDASARWQLNDVLGLSAALRSGMDLLDPIDGVASGKTELEGGVRLAVAEPLALAGTLGFSRETGLYAPELRRDRRFMRAALTYVPAPNAEIGIYAERAQVEAPLERYETLVMGVSGGVKL